MNLNLNTWIIEAVVMIIPWEQFNLHKVHEVVDELGLEGVDVQVDYAAVAPVLGRIDPSDEVARSSSNPRKGTPLSPATCCIALSWTSLGCTLPILRLFPLNFGLSDAYSASATPANHRHLPRTHVAAAMELQHKFQDMISIQFTKMLYVVVVKLFNYDWCLQTGSLIINISVLWDYEKITSYSTEPM